MAAPNPNPNPSDPVGALADLVPSGSSIHHEPPESLRCCCGRDECAFLQHSNSVLDNVERDVHTAAKLGQALLARHEAYIADTERDRSELTTRIERLEMDKRKLQADNARTVEENRALLDQLETLNSQVNGSDIKIQTLEVTLLSSQQAVRRLEGAASRAEEMERHVALLEREQMQLQNTLVDTESEARSSVQRWKKAERGISELQVHLERMEKETKNERDRHVEAMDRVERQRDVDKELNTAAGRLKGAAAAKSLDKGKAGGAVVSHFVRDLLQDNANLQLGLSELREMLTNSNDEIQALRNQLMYHQAVGDGDGEDSSASTLRAELETSQPPETPSARLSQDFHIHHHYHVAQKQQAKKPKKKRAGLTNGIYTPPGASGSSTPSRSGGQCRLSSPPAPALLSHAHRDSTPTPFTAGAPTNRWSVFSEQPSEFAASSVPSSPQSNYRYSMFDRIADSDPPLSPTTSVDPMSPTLRASHSKRPSETSTRSISVPTKLMPTPSTPVMTVTHHTDPEPIREETREDDTQADGDKSPPGLVTPTGEESTTEESEEATETPRRQLHRAASVESIMSLTGGLDIHTLKARPSQLTLRHLGGAEAVFSSVTASSTLSRVTNKRSSAALRDSLAGRPTSQLSPTPTRALSPSGSTGSRGENSGKLTGWSTWRPWRAGGSTGTRSSPDAAIADPDPSSAPSSDSKADKEKDNAIIHRASGINQPGSIPGFQHYLAHHQRRGAPSKVLPDVVDVDSLREGLQG